MTALCKVWLDTDIGSDIDDSVALAYLLKKPECRLLGVSTVSGQSAERALLADILCQAAGTQIPIFPGVEEPLFTPQRQPAAHQTKYLDAGRRHGNYPPGRAIEAMYQAISQNPGKVTLLTIGPLTNAALLFKVHPDAVHLLKNVVSMCGEFFGNSSYGRCENEWNSYCDPYASAIVSRTPNVHVRYVGLDVTTQVVMSPDEVKAAFQSPLLRAVYDFSGFSTNERASLTYHDPLAAVSIFKPEIMGYRTGNVSVDVKSEYVLGRTYFHEEGGGMHEVAVTVDKTAFFKEYFAVANS